MKASALRNWLSGFESVAVACIELCSLKRLLVNCALFRCTFDGAEGVGLGDFALSMAESGASEQLALLGYPGNDWFPLMFEARLRMEMTSLKLLHRSMVSISADMQQFQVAIGAASFDCLFSSRDEPFVLTLTSRGKSPGFLRFDVLRGYMIRDYLGEMYATLVAILRTDGRSGKRLVPKEFFFELNQLIPTHAIEKAIHTPSEIVRLRPDIVEDREKPFFDTWIYWNQLGKRGPTAENQHKTLVLLGREAEKHSREQNASSRWSATDTGRCWSS